MAQCWRLQRKARLLLPVPCVCNLFPNPVAYHSPVPCNLFPNSMPLPERQLIARLRRKSRRSSQIALGIGDDCAILRLPPDREILVTTDFSLEDVHFRRDWQSPECIGHRCLTRGLSDIAAMGGRPIAAFLSLALPAELPQKWADRFLDGLLKLARRHKIELAGGDTAQSAGGVLADIVVTGSVPRGKALRRSGAKVGDQIYVTGELGASAVALQLLASGKVKKRDVYPEPRIAIGEWLLENRIASAAIDISDGLSTDLSHLCEESRLGAVIEAGAISIHQSAHEAVARIERLPQAQSRKKAERRTPPSGGLVLDLALHGGDDYELLFTAPKSKGVPSRIAGVKITRIGEMVRGRGLGLSRNGETEYLAPKGWEYFR